jgi:hypothetical protein
MKMNTPPHPSRRIRSVCLESLGLSVTEGAKLLGVPSDFHLKLERIDHDPKWYKYYPRCSSESN